MALIEVEKVKIQWRAVEFDASAGSDSFDDVFELFDWAGAQGYVNSLKDWMPSIDIPEKKPAYPGEKRSAYVNHGDYIVANNRGKVEVVTEDEFYERFRAKVHK